MEKKGFSFWITSNRSRGTDRGERSTDPERRTVHRSRTANGPPIPNGERRETVHEPRTANRSRRTTDRQPLPVGFGLGIGRRGPPCLTGKNNGQKKGRTVAA